MTMCVRHLEEAIRRERRASGRLPRVNPANSLETDENYYSPDGKRWDIVRAVTLYNGDALCVKHLERAAAETGTRWRGNQ